MIGMSLQECGLRFAPTALVTSYLADPARLVLLAHLSQSAPATILVRLSCFSVLGMAFAFIILLALEAAENLGKHATYVKDDNGILLL